VEYKININNLDDSALLAAIMIPIVFKNITGYMFNIDFVSNKNIHIEEHPSPFLNIFYCNDYNKFKDFLNIDTKFIYKFKNSMKSKNNVYASPYHWCYYYHINMNILKNIFINMNLSNCYLFAELYNINIKELNFKETKYCKDKFIFEFESIEERPYSPNHNKLYQNYILYNYLCEFISRNFYLNDDNNVKIDNLDLKLLSFNCAGDIINDKLKNIVDIHLNSSPGELFIYDFDETLSVYRHELDKWVDTTKIKIEYLKNNTNPKSDIFPLFDIKKLSEASKKNKILILTMRSSKELAEIKEYVKYFDINSYILPAGDYHLENRYFTKIEVLNQEWNNIKDFIELNANTKIKSIYFADDLSRNFIGFDTFCKNKNIKLKLFLVNLLDEYLIKYIS
jgi:hypothetical protein